MHYIIALLLDKLIKNKQTWNAVRVWEGGKKLSPRENNYKKPFDNEFLEICNF